MITNFAPSSEWPSSPRAGHGQIPASGAVCSAIPIPQAAASHPGVLPASVIPSSVSNSSSWASESNSPWPCFLTQAWMSAASASSNKAKRLNRAIATRWAALGVDRSFLRALRVRILSVLFCVVPDEGRGMGGTVPANGRNRLWPR